MENHQEKQEIFDRYAKSVCEEYNNWTDLCIDHFESNYPKYMDEEQFFSSLMFHVNNACDLVQEEHQKRIAENARLDFHDGYWKTNKQLKYFQSGADNLTVDKDSITNLENLIK